MGLERGEPLGFSRTVEHSVVTAQSRCRDDAFLVNSFTVGIIVGGDSILHGSRRGGGRNPENLRVGSRVRSRIRLVSNARMGSFCVVASTFRKEFVSHTPQKISGRVDCSHADSLLNMIGDESNRRFANQATECPRQGLSLGRMQENPFDRFVSSVWQRRSDGTETNKADSSSRILHFDS
jgi:hypothetical protein